MADRVPSETRQPAPIPRLLVELPSWPRVFADNLRDLFSPPRLAPLKLQSAPAPFWPDVFVKRELPWRRFLDSGAFHLIACAMIVGVSRLVAMQPQAVLRPTFDHTRVISYQASEYLPPLDTRRAPPARPKRADPEFSRQPIISVPAEADNRSQTIVAAPSVKLKHDVALPNIVAWSDKVEKPRLEIPAAPLTLAAELNRIGPRMERSVVTPPPDAGRVAIRRNQATLQNSVVAPPPEVRASNSGSTFMAPQAAVIAPPPSVETAPTRPVGDLNIGQSAVIAPAPQLAVGEQRTISAGRKSVTAGLASQVVAPPPALSGGSSSGFSGASFGSRGRVIALNLHPAVGGPPDPPAGNRRGAFAATPEGHAGALGSAGSTAAATMSNGHENGGTRETDALPSGLYVGNAGAKTSPVAGARILTTSSVNPNLIASVRTPRVSSTPSPPMQPAGASKLSEAERSVFGDRKFYSLTLNMPNLNSAGGSWIIRFAELDHDSGRYSNNRDSDSNHDATSSTGDLSQPAATRKVDPAYPLQLMRENVAGTVILYAIIHADGTVGSVRVLRGVDGRLDRFASEAVSQWKFQPATKNGTAVDVEATFQIPFRPGRVGTNF